MPSPLLLTKMLVPEVRPALVPRPRLGSGPGTASTPRLTLVSAPAGFGKTTLVAGWARAAAAQGRPVAWVSLEESEREARLFWTYVASAVETASPGAGAAALSLLQTHAEVPAVLATLLNQLSALPRGIDLVLDDYHLADGPAIADDVAFLVEHLPPGVCVVVTTRSDPALPLPRMRARGDLVELRAADLRFTRDEVARYTRDVAGLELSAADIAVLEGRTEGWVAALQLAGLSLQGRGDATGFIAGFAGDDRYIVDYLVEEVLSRQPPDVRDFLLRTSILDRLSGPLCDAVTGGRQTRAVLEMLDRSNMFVVPLDGSRQWYRYHHLFADVLRTHLLDESPSEVAELHRRAGQWFSAAGQPLTAVQHLLAAGDTAGAADAIERTVIGLLRDRREATVRGWIDEVPADEVARRPMLALGFIGVLMSSGDVDGARVRLDALDELLASAARDPAVQLVVADDDEFARLPGAMEMYRAALALIGGDLTATATHANRAVASAADGDHLTVSAASALSGLASWTAGDLDEAHRRYTHAVDGLRRAGNLSDVLGCSITLGDISTTQGRLGDAQRTYEHALRLVSADAAPVVLRGTADMDVGLSLVALEHGDLVRAEEHLIHAEELGEELGLPQHPYRRRVARARLAEAHHDLAAAAALLEEAERVYAGDFSPNVQPVPARRARVLLAQGRTEEAVAWAHGESITPDDDLSYVREYEHVTLARILMRQARPEAHGLLERLHEAAEAGGRTGTVIEVVVLQALEHHAQHGPGNRAGALVLLERALRLAEPEGHVRVFTSEGPAISPLLLALTRRHPDWAYPRRLLDATTSTSVRRVPRARTALVDPLSARELDVLRLLGSDLDGPAIARELVVSLNTVRTHTKNIYVKLGVNNRREAVSRARELDLLSHTDIP